MAEVAEPFPAPALGEGEEEIDERFEYDAPRFYDFDEGSPAGTPAVDGWFDTEGPKGLATPLRPSGQEQAAGPNPSQDAAAGATENENMQQQQAAQAGKCGKGSGFGWRRALGSITNTTKVQQQGAAARPADKQTKCKAAVVAAAARAGGSKSHPAAASGPQQQQKRRKQQSPRKDDAAAADPPQPSFMQATASSPQRHLRPRSAAAQQKTSEQRELEQVQHEKEAAAALRRHNAVAVKHVLQPPPPPVAHSSRPLTEPVALELNTSKRHQRMHSMETRSMTSPYKSIAEQVAAFEGRLPGKSRLPGSSSAAEAAPKQLQEGHGGMATLTVPMSPQFATKRRVRPARFKPREVVEAEEMAAMPKFKAMPVNKRILQARPGRLGVPLVDIKPPTVPEPFALKTDKRAAEHGPPSSSAAAASSSGGDAAFVFGAQGDRVVRSKATKKKAAWTGQLTQLAPFALATDVRGAIKRSAAAELQQEPQDVRPAKRARKTAVGPFQLATDQRGAAEEERIKGMRRQKEEQSLREAEFKALPLNKAALAGAWKPPAAVPHELTVPQNVMLHSEARAVQRRQFDQAVAAHAAELDAERQRLQALQQQQEEAEVRQLRKQQGHKALPLPDRL